MAMYCLEDPRDDDESYEDPFETNKERRYFVGKVFTVVALMIFVAVMFVSTAYFSDTFYDFLVQNQVLVFISFIIWTVVYLLLICIPYLRQKKPINYILLIVMTLSMGFMLASITAAYNADAILFAALGTLAITICAMIFCFVVPCDITGWGPYLFVVFLALVVAAVAGTIFCVFGFCKDNRKLYSLILSILFLIIYSLYLVYDIQMIIGNRKHKIDKNDYILAVILLWTDVVNIFLCLLRLSRDLDQFD